MPVWTLGWLCASPEAIRPCSWHDACLDSGLAFAPVWRPSGLTCWLFGLRAGLCASLEASSFPFLCCRTPVWSLCQSGGWQLWSCLFLCCRTPVWSLCQSGGWQLCHACFCAVGLWAGLCASLEAGSFVMLVFALSDSGLASVPVWRLAVIGARSLDMFTPTPLNLT